MTDARITLTIDAEERELFMSFGLLNRVITVVQSIERVPMIAFDNNLRNEVLRLVLSVRKGKKIEKAFDPDETESDPEEIEKAMSWVQEHVAAFFTKQLRKQMELMKDMDSVNSEMEQLLVQSETGSQD